VIFDEQRRFAAIGLWDPGSVIRIKILHVGQPRTIDSAFWSARLTAALEQRETLWADPETTALRWVHGENDRLAGLVVDRYDTTLVIKIYSEAWFAHLDDLVAEMVRLVDPVRVVVRLARNVAAPAGLVDGSTIVGPPPDGPIRFRERGLTFAADVVAGNKTGHFLDQRDNRALVRAAAMGADVLDVFSSTGGFAVSAAAGGASSVHLVDVSRAALVSAEANLAANRHIAAVRGCSVRITCSDAFEFLRGALDKRDRYDVVVLDPPSFASSQREVDRALGAYRRLTAGGLRLLRPGGLLVQASCSSRVDAESFFDAVRAGAESSGIEISEVRRTGHPLDHPIGFEHGAYLKAVFARRLE